MEVWKSHLSDLAYAVWAMTAAMAPWLLVGFALAGVLSQLVPVEWIRRHLSGRGPLSVVKAVLAGIPLPLCSCGVIPVAASLGRAGASKGAVAAFTAATPQTGVDSIAATYSLMGLPFTLGRLAADVISGLLAGILINLSDRSKEAEHEPEPEPESCCCQTGGCGDGEPEQALPEASPARQRLRAVWHEGFVVLPRDIGGYIVLGLLLGGLLSVLVPPWLVPEYLDHPLLSYLVVTLISVPVYVCATGSIPIAFGLLAAGISPGAAIVFLVTGPATNTATVLTLLKLIGKRATAIYLVALVTGAWTVGFLFDQTGIVPREGFAAMAEGPGWLGSVSAVVFAGLLLNAYRPRR